MAENIYSAILAIQQDIQAIAKKKKNETGDESGDKKFNYAFRGIDDVYNTVHPLFAKHGVFSIPTILSERYEISERVTTYWDSYSKTNKEKKSYVTSVYLRVKYTFYAADGSNVSATLPSEASDYSDKATNKALAFAHKYSIIQVFSIPTADLIDGDGENPEKGKEIKDQQIKEPEKKQNDSGSASEVTISESQKEAWRKTLFSKDRKKEITELTDKTYAGYKKWLGQYRSVMTKEEYNEFKVLLDNQKTFIDEARKREQEEGRKSA